MHRHWFQYVYWMVWIEMSANCVALLAKQVDFSWTQLIRYYLFGVELVRMEKIDKTWKYLIERREREALPTENVDTKAQCIWLVRLKNICKNRMWWIKGKRNRQFSRFVLTIQLDKCLFDSPREISITLGGIK